MQHKQKTLSGWGRYPGLDCRTAAPATGPDAARLLIGSEGTSIPRGNGRAYGDSALNPGFTMDMRRLNRMLAFDPAEGVLTAEAGVILGDVITAFLPRGWFPMVTPGTKFVSLGGAIAADVHGKNHHGEGSFGAHVLWLDLLTAEGELRCSPTENTELFAWTIGGMGLTGVILRAAIRLRPVSSSWIRQTTLPAKDLRGAIDLFEAHMGATYSVAWIDCLATGRELGRSLVMLGEHATPDELPRYWRPRPLKWPTRKKRSVPFDAPSMALNGLSVRAFNALYYAKGKKNAGKTIIDWDSYFYPLDAVLHWNRIYGKRGFAQFQCALPLSASEAGMTQLLNTISQAGAGSFLAVLKRFGPQDSPFSFPMEGYTLALDFPMNKSALGLLDQLDAITVDHGGRFYLAKDARMSRATLNASDPRAQAFRAMRRNSGADRVFSSLQSERLAL